MKITDFEQFLSEAVQHEGQDIFVNEQVSPPEEDKANTWQATVRDHESGACKVSIQLSNTTVKDAHCSCEREGWPCAHIVAMLYQLYAQREEQKKTKKKDGKKPARSAKKDPVKEVFDHATKDDLERFIKSQFKRDRLLRVHIISELGHLLTHKEADPHRLAMRKAQEMALGKNDTVTTRNQLECYTKSADKLIKKGQKAFHNEHDLDTALKTSLAVLETAPAIMHKSKMGKAEVYHLMEASGSLLSALMKELPPPRQEETLAWLIERMGDDNAIQALDPLMTLMDIITAHLQHQEDLISRFEERVEAVLQANKPKTTPKVSAQYISRNDKICQETVLEMIEFYHRLKRTESARSIADRFLYLGPVRYERAQMAIQEGELETARKLAEEFLWQRPAYDYTGIQIFTNVLEEIKTARKATPAPPKGRISSEGAYEEARPEKASNPEDDFLAYGELDDFEQRRALSNEEDWPEVRRTLLRKLGEQKPIDGDTQWTEIYRYYEEGDWESMLTIVQKHPRSLLLVGQFGSALYFEFPDEMRAVYRQCLKYHLQQSMDLEELEQAVQILQGLISIVLHEDTKGKLWEMVYQLFLVFDMRKDVPPFFKSELRSELSKLINLN